MNFIFTLLSKLWGIFSLKNLFTMCINFLFDYAWSVLTVPGRLTSEYRIYAIYSAGLNERVLADSARKRLTETAYERGMSWLTRVKEDREVKSIAVFSTVVFKFPGLVEIRQTAIVFCFVEKFDIKTVQDVLEGFAIIARDDQSIEDPLQEDDEKILNREGENDDTNF